MPARMLGPKGGRWIVRSHIGWGGERNIGQNPASGRLEPLHMVSEPDNG